MEVNLAATTRDNETFFHRLCGKFGRFVALHPCLVIILSLLFAGGCGYCISFVEVSTRPRMLYTVRDGIAQKDNFKWYTYWGNKSRIGDTAETNTRSFDFILSSKHDENVFTRDNVQKLLEIHNVIFNFSGSSSNQNLNDTCYRNGKNDNKCKFTCFVEYFDFNTTIIDRSFDFYDKYLNLDLYSNNNTQNNYTSNKNDTYMDSDFYEAVFSNIESIGLNVNNASANDEMIDQMVLNVILCPYALSYYTQDFQVVYQRAGLPLKCNNATDYGLGPILLASLVLEGFNAVNNVLEPNENGTITIDSYQEYLIYLIIQNIISETDNNNTAKYGNMSNSEFYDFDVTGFNTSSGSGDIMNMSTSELVELLFNDIIASEYEKSGIDDYTDINYGIMSYTPAYLCSYDYNLPYIGYTGQMDYERELYNFLDNFKHHVSKSDSDSNKDLKMTFYFSQGIGWELSYLASGQANLPYFITSCILLIIYSAVATIHCGKCRRQRNNNVTGRWCDNIDTISCDIDISQSCLGLFGVLSTLIAIISTFGFVGGILGVPFNALVTSAGLVLLGIGVDDMYVILHSMQVECQSRLTNKSIDNKNKIQNKDHRNVETQKKIGVNEISNVMKHCGPSIFLTSTTDLVAFIASAFSSPFNAVLQFCIYTGVGIVFDFIFQVTFFMAIVSLYYNHCHCFDWCKNKIRKLGGAQNYHAEVQSEETINDNDEEDTEDGNDDDEVKKRDRYTHTTMMARFGKLLFKYPYAGMFVVFGLLCYWIVSIYSIFNILEVDVNTAVYLAKSSPMTDFLRDLDEHFSYMGSTVEICIDKEDLDYTNKSIQNLIVSMTNEIVNGDNKISSQCFGYDILTESWIESYVEYLNTHYIDNGDEISNMTKPEWYQILYSKFLNSDSGKKYIDDIWETRVLDNVIINSTQYESESDIFVDSNNLNYISNEIIIGNQLFNDSRLTQITRSKISIQMTTKGSLNIHGGNMKCLELLESMSKKYKKQLGVYFYYKEAVYHEVGMVIEQVTRDNVLYTALSVFIICLIFMQNRRIVSCDRKKNNIINRDKKRCNWSNVSMFGIRFVFGCTITPALFTALIVFQILVGVVGFSAIIGIPLNLITSLLIAVSIGFSVDNVAHFVFAYTNANINIDKITDKRIDNCNKKKEREYRSIYGLEMMAKPIVIGDLSTIIAIFPLLFSPSQVNVHIFWVIFVTMMNGILHGILILPIILGYIGPTNQNSTNFSSLTANDEVSLQTKRMQNVEMQSTVAASE